MRRIPAALLTLSLAVAALSPGVAQAAGPAQDHELPDGAVRASDGRMLPPMPDGVHETSIHAEMLEEHADDPVSFEPGGAPTILLSDNGAARLTGDAVAPDGAVATSGAAGSTTEASIAGLPNGLRKEVFGFLPYWMLTDDALQSLNYKLLSTIAYFSVNAQGDGDLAKGTSSSPTSGWSGWNSSAMTGVLDRAHDNGVRVVLTVTMMSWDSTSASHQAALLQSSTARSRLVNQIVSTIRTRGADGVNLDFEPLASSLRDEYVSFVKQLKRGLVNAGVGDYLTVSVMASAATWATGYDVPGLTQSDAANALFVMGYDYNWSGSSRAGGVAPIQSPYTIDVAGTMADFLTQTSGSKIIWGVPYYGRTWPTETKNLNAPTLGGGSKAYVYTGSLSQAAQFGRRWDDVGKVPWYRYWDGGAGHWVQGYYDDVTSLGVKYDLVNARGLRGTGMWTLLMDQGRDELWRLLARKFVNDSAPPEGGIRILPVSTDAEVVKVQWRAADYASGVSDYDVQWRRPDGSWRTLRSRTRATAAWFTGTAGETYQFRMRARDMKGNVQAWTTVPLKPATLQAGGFGKVVADTLNVRSGPGTGYGIVDTKHTGDVVYVLEGPVASGGYEWYRVQYGFSEWPSADYPLIAWMAGTSSGTPMMAPRRAPSVITMSPFVAQDGRTTTFSPNADGTKDVAAIDYTLAGAASAVRLDVVDDQGSVVRSMSLGSQPAGANEATWDGRLTSGSYATDGEYLARIIATDTDGDHHAGPGPFSAEALARWGIEVDRTAPTATVSPRPGAEMVAATAHVVIAFNEPMVGLATGPASLTADGASLPVTVDIRPDRKRLTVQADEPLPTDEQITASLAASVRDAAGNPPTVTAWAFMTAPGRVFAPARPGTLETGTRSGYAIAQDGDLLRVHVIEPRSPRPVAFAQRAWVPNLPGYWLYMSSGPLAGDWLREAGRQHIDGVAARTAYDAAQTIRLVAGTQTGYKFTASGAVWRSRSVTLSASGRATSVQRAVINGAGYWRITGGALDGYWVKESASAYAPGKIEMHAFTTPPRVDVAAGRYTAHRYDWLGRESGSQTASIGTTTGIRVSAWAVVNGTAQYLVSSGPWAGYWLPETAATRLHV